MQVRVRWFVAVFVLGGSMLLASVMPPSVPVAGQTDPDSGLPLAQLSGDSFDRAFLQMMVVHHAMAVAMARPALANAQHPELQQLAQEIITSQLQEIDEMRGWLWQWYGVDMPDPMAMMDMEQSGQMPMADTTTMPASMMLEELGQLPSNRLDVVFMSLMITHHQSAIGMAQLAPERASHQELKDLATDIIAAQAREIDEMNGWLAAWYGL